MEDYRLSVPLTEQTKGYLSESQEFLWSLKIGDDDLSILIGNALKLFELYLDRRNNGIVVMDFSNNFKKAFSMEEVAKEMHKKPVETLFLSGISYVFYRQLERVRVKACIKDHSEVVIYAISYFAFLVEIYLSEYTPIHADLFEGACRLSLYEVGLFSSYQPRWIQ